MDTNAAGRRGACIRRKDPRVCVGLWAYSLRSPLRHPRELKIYLPRFPMAPGAAARLKFRLLSHSGFRPARHASPRPTARADDGRPSTPPACPRRFPRTGQVVRVVRARTEEDAYFIFAGEPTALQR